MPPSTDSEPLLGRLLAGIESELPAAVELRRRLHADPELAHREHRTAAALARELPVESRAAAGTGILARVGPAGGPAIAVRAELDGLPIEERSGAAYRASDGVMHACGHDVHMAALVALTRAAHGLGEALPVALVAVFQPSEEAYPSGAELLARGGLAELAPEAVVAAHVQPDLPWGTVALDAGTVNASSDNFEIVVEGEPSHGSYPHRGRDPILALSHVIVALHAQIGRRIDPTATAVLNVGVLEGGEAENVIPALARARGSLRAHRREDRDTLRGMLEEVVTGVAAAHGTRGTITIAAGEPALANDPAIVSRARELLTRAGLEAAPAWLSAGSDDFAFFGELAPLAMGFVGLDGAEGFTARPLHHPELLPPDAAVGAVARVQAVLYTAAAELMRRG
ncbi:MAG TPA: M20 family metallopeptidase [Solirubrobacteraceae bacterium]|jgi:amidohydrolase|nr:M20 family metallopeptidase [Solirubrobacteraceae bacterium]